MAVCGRSEMIMPLGVGNLQKGERCVRLVYPFLLLTNGDLRYANMDYIFGSALRFVFISLLLISYDIACQWFINLYRRIEEQWPEEIKPRPDFRFNPAIPKLHEPMHGSVGHEVYSFNYIPGVGETDGECIERIWSPHNALGNSTKTMGPGSRHDILDDHFGFWNWQKYISQGKTLLRRYKNAVADRNVQVVGFEGLSKSVGKELSDQWEKMCMAWESDGFPKTAKNPYHTENACK